LIFDLALSAMTISASDPCDSSFFCFLRPFVPGNRPLNWFHDRTGRPMPLPLDVWSVIVPVDEARSPMRHALSRSFSFERVTWNFGRSNAVK